MDNDLNKGVEKKPADAPTGTEVKKEEGSASVPPVESTGIDYEREFNALLEENNRIANDRDNYKKGLLAAKGKAPELDLESTELDTLIEKKVQDTLLRTKEFQNNQAREELVKKVFAENKELKIALANKSGISSVAPGSSVSRPDVKVESWTPEQLAYFAKRNLNPDKVKENYIKTKSKTV